MANNNVVFSAHNVTIRKELNTILSNINFDINEGELISLVGSAGSGKTTLAQLITGEIEPYSGNVTRAEGIKSLLVTQQDNFF